ncbi:hypothetical protein GOBAR_DD08124 [Gossypium barbadense]|nr:hypothetical protein GOBAR_DD08124 [Gossypium barbadense]
MEGVTRVPSVGGVSGICWILHTARSNLGSRHSRSDNSHQSEPKTGRHVYEQRCWTRGGRPLREGLDEGREAGRRGAGLRLAQCHMPMSERVGVDKDSAARIRESRIYFGESGYEVSGVMSRGLRLSILCAATELFTRGSHVDEHGNR